MQRSASSRTASSRDAVERFLVLEARREHGADVGEEPLFVLDAPELDLGPLAGRDVEHRPQHPGRLALRIASEYLASVEDPDPRAGLGLDAELAFVLGGRPAK